MVQPAEAACHTRAVSCELFVAHRVSFESVDLCVREKSAQRARVLIEARASATATLANSVEEGRQIRENLSLARIVQ
jgi:hypothetical protein